MIKYRYNSIIKLNLEKSGTWQSPFEQSGTWKYPRNESCFDFLLSTCLAINHTLIWIQFSKFRWILDYFCVFVCLTDNVCSLKDHTILQCSVVQYSSQCILYMLYENGSEVEQYSPRNFPPLVPQHHREKHHSRCPPSCGGSLYVGICFCKTLSIESNWSVIYCWIISIVFVSKKDTM